MFTFADLSFPLVVALHRGRYIGGPDAAAVAPEPCPGRRLPLLGLRSEGRVTRGSRRGYTVRPREK